jgi:hypothetical protein
MSEVVVKVDTDNIIRSIIHGHDEKGVVEFVYDLIDAAAWYHQDVRESTITRLKEGK